MNGMLIAGISLGVVGFVLLIWGIVVGFCFGDNDKGINLCNAASIVLIISSMTDFFSILYS